MRNSYVKIDVNVRNYFRSIKTAMVFDLLIRFCGKNPDGFWKFKEPCKKNPFYKKGDSWSEELLMSRKVLNRSMAPLVTHYKTKNAYLKSNDKFCGKMFCSYTDHKTNLTYYFMDKEAVQQFQATLLNKGGKNV